MLRWFCSVVGSFFLSVHAGVMMLSPLFEQSYSSDTFSWN